MSDENHFFSPVAEVANANIVSCDAGSSVTEVARLMRDHGISSVIVSEQGKPHGIISDRDLRNKVVAAGLAPDALLARDIMTAPFLAIAAERPLHEALHQMSRRRIHRLCVLDGKGELAGIVTSTDIMRLQARSALGLILDIEQASTVDALAPLHERVQELVLQQVRQGVPTTSLVRTVAHLNDRILIRLIELVREKDFPNLTQRFAFMVLGSEGRGEQTLATDQDNAIVYADDLSPAEVEELTCFSEAVIAALIGIGVPECPGGIMARSPVWRRSLSEWQSTLAQWFSNAKPDNILSGSMFFDQRTVYGDPAFERQLKDFIDRNLRDNAPFLAHTAANVLRFPPPLGFFGGIKATRKDGARVLDMKKAGIFAITEGVKVLAQQAGLHGGNTHDRIGWLLERKILSADMARDLVAAFELLVALRLRAQVEAIAAGQKPVNLLRLDGLDSMQTGRLKMALATVKRFGSVLEHRFRLQTMG
ncbi:MAG: DUF294 nucleotidyltransferase-like domain-containing protein [Azonexus sp.]|jgi:CBS domain-containing protein|nr:DUF294 nucleotidyltransferase-like domain-containing protein [Azonexus sp.]